ncbi:hypothetical protein A5865_003621, partial [Enterococcus sp. 12E11_DIV0728]
YIMINIFGVSSNTSNISNVFRRNKTWFHSEEIDGNLKKKLLQNGKKYVNSFLHTIEV